jgi:septum site-determining protein MinD
MVKNNDMMSVEDVLDILSVKLIGVIPDDEQVIVSTNKGEPLVLSDKASLAGTAYMNVAKRLEGNEVEFLQLESPPKGIFARLSSWISGNY